MLVLQLLLRVLLPRAFALCCMLIGGLACVMDPLSSLQLLSLPSSRPFSKSRAILSRLLLDVFIVLL